MRVGKHDNSAEVKTWPLITTNGNLLIVWGLRSIACERPRLEKGEKDAKTHRIVGRIWGRMRGIFGFGFESTVSGSTAPDATRASSGKQDLSVSQDIYP